MFQVAFDDGARAVLGDDGRASGAGGGRSGTGAVFVDPLP